MAEAPTRERLAIQFGGSVLRDGWQILLDRNANGAFVFQPFLTVAAFRALQPTGNLQPLAKVTTGIADINGGDGAELMFGGSTGGTASWLVQVYDPVYAVTDTGKQTPTGFVEAGYAQGTLTFNGLPIGAAGAAALASGNGILAADNLASTFAITTVPAGNVAMIELVIPNAMSRLLVNVRGDRFIHVQMAVGTATAMWCLARRLQGRAQRGRG